MSGGKPRAVGVDAARQVVLVDHVGDLRQDHELDRTNDGHQPRHAVADAGDAGVAALPAGVLVRHAGFPDRLIFRRERRLLAAAARLRLLPADAGARRAPPGAAPVRIFALVVRCSPGQRDEQRRRARDGGNRAVAKTHDVLPRIYPRKLTPVGFARAEAVDRIPLISRTQPRHGDRWMDKGAARQSALPKIFAGRSSADGWLRRSSSRRSTPRLSCRPPRSHLRRRQVRAFLIGTHRWSMRGGALKGRYFPSGPDKPGFDLKSGCSALRPGTRTAAARLSGQAKPSGEDPCFPSVL